MKTMTRILPVALAVGIALGVLFPEPADAFIAEVIIQNHQGGNGYLTCGWHGSSSACGSGGAGALDWDNADSADVKWRSWTYNSSSSSSVFSATADPYDSQGTCYSVTVELRDLWGSYQGAVAYKHTTNDGSSFNILGTTGYYWQDSNTVGTSVPSGQEKQGCGFDGSHVHQHSAGGFATHDHSTPAYYPSDSQCQLGVVNTYCGTLSDRHTYHYHQLFAAFTY